MVAPTKFGALLASNDKETRDKALKAVTRFLKRAHNIDELELAKVPPCSASALHACVTSCRAALRVAPSSAYESACDWLRRCGRRSSS